MIELKNVSKTYKSKKGVTTRALSKINLKFGNNHISDKEVKQLCVSIGADNFISKLKKNNVVTKKSKVYDKINKDNFIENIS